MSRCDPNGTKDGPSLNAISTASGISSRTEAYAPRFRTSNRKPDVTLINLNLMLVNQDGTFDQQAYIPLGPLYIAAVLDQENVAVELIDYQLFSMARSFDAAIFVESIRDFAPIVGISCMSNLLPFAVVVSREIKRRSKSTKVVLGGVGPSPVARELIDAFPFIDCVVEGEGELNMLNLLHRNGSKVPKPQLVTDLDTLPLPSYSLINFSLYNAAPSIITSRGCPYKCSFCTEPYNFGGRVRFRSVESVLYEIELVHDVSGKNMFLFQDDILPLKPSRFEELLSGLRKMNFPIEWKCFARTDLVDKEIMEEMAGSGCKQIRFGIESGSNRVLEKITKGFRIEDAFDVARQAVNIFPSVHASFIWGYPFEDEHDLDQTLQWVARFEAAGITVLLFEYAPLPGSPLYKEHKEGLEYLQNEYSFYVVTGHEIVDRHGYKSSDRFSEIHDLIKSNPAIFSGFYRYRNLDLPSKRRHLTNFKSTRRTPLRNEYDL